MKIKGALFKALAIGMVIASAIAVIALTNASKATNGSWFGKALDPARKAYDFELTNQDGAPFRLSDEQGSVVMLNFGFTCCPNICPVSLTNLAAMRSSLPPEARKRVKIVFISVDKRDTSESLKKYMKLFDDKFTGLTGDPEKIGNVTRAYGAFFRKDTKGPQDEENYLIDHSTKTYLIDPQGNLRLVYELDQLSNTAALSGDVLRILDLPTSNFKP
jgi:protein SCO1/2